MLLVGSCVWWNNGGQVNLLSLPFWTNSGKDLNKFPTVDLHWCGIFPRHLLPVTLTCHVICSLKIPSSTKRKDILQNLRKNPDYKTSGNPGKLKSHSSHSFQWLWELYYGGRVDLSSTFKKARGHHLVRAVGLNGHIGFTCIRLFRKSINMWTSKTLKKNQSDYNFPNLWTEQTRGPSKIKSFYVDGWIPCLQFTNPLWVLILALTRLCCHLVISHHGVTNTCAPGQAAFWCIRSKNTRHCCHMWPSWMVS